MSRIVRRRKAILRRFDANYENLVDLLCLAAQCADVSRFRSSYTRLRYRLVCDYSVLRSAMIREAMQAWPRAQLTPFDVLLEAQQIDNLIHDASVMDLMVSCRWLLDQTTYVMNAGNDSAN